tara:strand:- start:2 stop:1729 length:1728 start_codon:yes stop_codon:yes gene_type:complete
MVEIGRYSGHGRGLSQVGADYFSGADTKGGALLQGIANAVLSGAGEGIDIIRDIYNTGNYAMGQIRKAPDVKDVVVGTAKYLASPSASAIEKQKKQEELKLLSPFGALQKYTPPDKSGGMGMDVEDFPEDINELIKNLDNQKDATKGATKGATDPDISPDLAPEDEGLPSPDIIKTDTTKADGKADTGTGTGGLTPEEQLMKSGMDSYIAALGEDVKVSSLEDYKKEFEKATGIDASGKVDKSMALTSLGLALMQNKAGKGFNVGNILSEVGKAGEKALPALEKAKSEARAGQLAAGQYALGQRQKDIATKQARSQDIANKIFDLNKLSVGQDFAMQRMNQKFIYDLQLKKQQLDNEISVLNMTPKELGDKYLGSAKTIDLFEGGDSFKIEVQLPDRNYKGKEKVAPNLLTDINSISSELNRRERDLNRVENEFKELNRIVEEGKTTIQAQIKSDALSVLKSFGVGLGIEDDTKRARYMLKTIQAGYAPLILGEAGKTISDADRERVRDIVGDLNYNLEGPEVLAQKLHKVYGLVVTSGRERLDKAYEQMNSYGYQLGPYAQKKQNQEAADIIVG